jgi:hypothetical protein
MERRKAASASPRGYLDLQKMLKLEGKPGADTQMG